MKILAFLTICFVFLIAKLAERLINRIISRIHERHEKLIARWEKARANRRQWLEDHWNPSNPFIHADYEDLWMTEIGAEELLYIRFPWATRRISREEYQSERAKYNAEEA